MSVLIPVPKRVFLALVLRLTFFPLLLSTAALAPSLPTEEMDALVAASANAPPAPSNPAAAASPAIPATGASPPVTPPIIASFV